MILQEEQSSSDLDPYVAVSSTTLQDSTRENDVCSSRGVCDYVTGECACFAGWSSSDGRGSEGSIEDCGHRLPIYGSTYLSNYDLDDETRLQKQVEQMGIKLWDKYNYKH